MTTLVTVLLAVLGVVCLAIPLTAVAVVHRDELAHLAHLAGRARRALAFDPRHPALDPHPGR